MALDPLRVPPHLQRPGSSHSNRSISHASQSSTTRLSQRTIIKQPRLAALLKTLVKQVTKVNETEDIQEGIDVAIKRIDQVKQASVPDLAQIDAQIRGHVKKAGINIQDSLADALNTKYAELKHNIAQRNDLDLNIKLATLPSYLHFLLLLSSPPTRFTLSQAAIMLTRKHDPELPSQPLTWQNILKEEPFQGQHWQGAYGLPMGSTVENWEEEESSEIDGLSLLDDAEYDEDCCSSSHHSAETTFHPKPFGGHDPFRHFIGTSGRSLTQTLSDRQYWRFGLSTNEDSHQKFDIGVPSSLGPKYDRVMSIGSTMYTEQEVFINEVDAVREVLAMLQGRQSCLFGSKLDGHDIEILYGRRIMHFTRGSQASILGSFMAFASTLNPLRHLVQGIVPSISPSGGPCRTFEAFLAVVERQLHAFDLWCARHEKHIGLAQQGKYSSSHVVSLLSLKQKVTDNVAGIFVILLDTVRTIEVRRDRTNPSTMSALILNTLLEAMRAANDTRTVKVLTDIWRESTEPLWTNLGKWLKDGIPIRLGFIDDHHKVAPTWDEKEFFIRINHLMDIGDPDFWDGGYTLPPRHTSTVLGMMDGHSEDEGCLPTFLAHVADHILAAGKAVGLLRAINMIHLVGDDWLSSWLKFEDLTKTLPLEGLNGGLEDLISDTLLPPCRLVQSSLRQVLIEKCELWKHLRGLENVCLMTRGDAMSQFGEKLFTRMDTRQPWNDFHFLNTAFREVARLGSQAWIHTSSVKFTHRGNKDANDHRTVRAINGLTIEFAVPFPLTYVFGPEISAGYSSLFCFLLQIRRAKSVLDRILIRGLNNDALDHGMPDLKVFHILRSKLSWFVNTFLNFIMTHVIHAGLLKFHNVLKAAVSLDEMISIRRSHLEQLLERCLLQSNTSVLHQSIISILDLTLQFSDCLSAFAGNTSLDISHHSLALMRHRPRPRREGRSVRSWKPDVIGFAVTLPPSEEEWDSESDEEDFAEPLAISSYNSFPLAEEDFFGRLEHIGLELDGLVRSVRRGVNSLAAGTGDASVTFGILAFYLEDWKF